jgi:lipoxygenase
MLSESRVEKPHRIYVPRDEAFEELKQGAFSSGRLRAVLHTLIPSLIATISAETHSFQGFHHVDNLYKEGLRLKLGLHEQLFQKIPLVQKIQESSEGMLRYDTPSILSSK